MIEKWIPVTERLPEDGKRVVCFMVYAPPLRISIQYNVWLGDEWEVDDGHVTHWMPLPLPPKVSLEDVVDIDKLIL